MVARIKWSQRRFALGLPAESAPELIERLRGTPARVQDRTERLPTATLTAVPASGGWSIQEHVGHLLDLETLFMGRLDDFDDGRRVLRPADMSNRATIEARHNERRLDDVLQAFRHARLALVARLEAMDATALARSAHHPRLDMPMRVVDMIYFQAEHDDYHLASITELLGKT
jgi:uncharacterized damage-inducible protein DinB